MGYPEPELGLVISYSYLWSEDAAAGHAEGHKTRPCAILLVIQQAEREPPRVTVAPITHSPPHDPGVAIEIPTRVKRHLGLDSERSWVIVDELNVFRWPGYDLRPIPDKGGRYDYGLLPPKFFESIVKMFRSFEKSASLLILRATMRNNIRDKRTRHLPRCFRVFQRLWCDRLCVNFAQSSCARLSIVMQIEQRAPARHLL